MDMNWSFRVRFSLKKLWCIWCNDYIKSRPRTAPQLRLKYFVCFSVKLWLHKRQDCISTILFSLHLQQTNPRWSGFKQVLSTACWYKATKLGHSFGFHHKKRWICTKKIHLCSNDLRVEHANKFCGPLTQ